MVQMTAGRRAVFELWSFTLCQALHVTRELMNKKRWPAVAPLLLFCVDGHSLTDVLTGL